MKKHFTKAQCIAVELARCEPIRYYTGGYYTIPSIAGDEREPMRPDGLSVGVHVTLATIASLVTAGVLAVDRDGDAEPAIYSYRWRLINDPAGKVQP